MSRRTYITSSIPYVNAGPHVGHALELVEADALARHRRLRGDDVRFLTGTDENAPKNAQAAGAAGLPVAELVARNAARFSALCEALEVSNDDFIRTSADPRHRPEVERLWRACALAGDLYQREYEGLYCAGCEAFLDGDRCPEHAEAPERVSERNWFFRLSRHERAIGDLLESGRLRIEPPERRAEALAFVRGGLADFSVSRPRARARGWGIPVPGDPTQVVYVWFDALTNYLTADPGWWRSADERIHVIGKGILRFHAVYWPAILLSSREPLPTAIYVHGYLTAGGQKLSKTLGNAVDPSALVERYGVDAVRWWLLREAPLAGDADFREELLVARANAELANGVGNLVHRTRGLLGTGPGAWYRGLAPSDTRAGEIDEALARFDFRAATGALWALVADANRFASATRPWELAGAARAAAVDRLLATCGLLERELRPFLPGGAGRIEAALAGASPKEPLFPRYFDTGSSL
jgi:methionyl-tRNA synthetase